MDANLNTQVLIGQTGQANIQPQMETPENKPELKPLLKREPNLTVSNAPLDLEALVAKLNVENEDTKANTAKQTLQSTFTNVIARAKERGNATTRNMELLEQAEIYSKQLENTTATIDQLTEQISQLNNIVATDQQEVDQIQKQVESLTAELEKLQGQITESDAQVVILQMEIDSLTKQIENEVDAQKLTNLKKRLADAQTKLETEKQDQNDRLDKLENTKNELAKAQTKLETAKGNLDAAIGTLAEAKNVLDAANNAKAELSQKIQQTLAEITDETIIKDIADALKIDASDVTSINDNNKAERSEEEEKYLEEHSSVKIFQEALSAHYQDILDTIEANRENIV